jgi:hypothetical protein
MTRLLIALQFESSFSIPWRSSDRAPFRAQPEALSGGYIARRAWKSQPGHCYCFGSVVSVSRFAPLKSQSSKN